VRREGMCSFLATGFYGTTALHNGGTIQHIVLHELVAPGVESPYRRRPIRRCREPDAALLPFMEGVMAKSRDRDSGLSSERSVPHRSLLFELKGKKTTEDGNPTAVSSEMFAALSIEEVIAYVRTRQPGSEIMELKVLGKVQVLSSSEHLA
jgi:hypothetical protein